MKPRTIEEFVNSEGVQKMNEKSNNNREVMYAVDEMDSESLEVTLLEIDCTPVLNKGRRVATGKGTIKGGIPVYLFKGYELAYDLFLNAGRIEREIAGPSLDSTKKDKLSTYLSNLNSVIESVADNSYTFTKKTLRDSY